MAPEKRLMCVDDFQKNLCHYCNTYMSEEPCEPGECWVHDVIAQTGTVDAVEVVHGRWVSMGPHEGHKCGVCEDYYTSEAVSLFYCPRCGAMMTEIEKIDYRRYGLPIGAPYKKTICAHGRKMDGEAQP